MRYTFNFFFLATVMLYSSCSSDDPTPSQFEMRTCHDNANADSIQIRNQLIGKWELVMVSCYSNPMSACENSTSIIADIRDNGELIFSKDDIVVQSSWQLIEKSINMHELIIEPSIEEMQGIIVLCDNRVEFRLSYIDLCDHRFKRFE